MKNLKLWVGLILLAVAMGAVAWLSGSNGSPGGMTSEHPATSGPAAASKPFTLKDAAGAQHALSDYRGQVVVLHFWATWCAPCVEEIPALLAFARKFDGKPFRLLLVSLDESWDVAWTVLPKKDLPSNVVSLIDPESKVPELYGSFQFPESYLIDREQGIRVKWVGMQKWGEPYFQKAIEALLQ